MWKEGTWSIQSKSDPRWDKSGRGIVGGGMTPEGARKHIEEMEEKYGERPEDLTLHWMKD